MLTQVLVFALIFIGAQASESHVLELNDETFQTHLNRYDIVNVMFYAPWCGHCKRLKPEYEKAAEILKYEESNIILAKIDCTEGGKETCNQHSVSGYPTLKIFRREDSDKNHEIIEYKGPRDAQGIVKYMKSQTGPASKEYKDESSLAKFLNSDDVVVVGYFEGKDAPLYSAFQSVANKMRENVLFGHVVGNKDLSKDLTNTIVLYRPKKLHNKFEPNHVEYTGGNDVSEIQEFIEKNYHGIAGIRTRNNAAEFKNPLVVAYYNVDYTKNPKGTNYWRNRILKVAKNSPEFNYAIASKDDFQHELNEFGLDYVKGDKPIILARNENNQKFIMKDEFTVEAFEKFLNDLKEEAIEPYIKSEDVPSDNSGPVKVAVAKNFEQIVVNNDKDILLEFYAPWCGHCKQLAPVLEELGEKLANEDVEIVKFDATANDVPPRFQVQGFPTLFWLPKGDKQNPVSYNGGREIDDFIKYIAEHATSPLKGFDKKGKPVKKDEL